MKKEGLYWWMMKTAIKSGMVIFFLAVSMYAADAVSNVAVTPDERNAIEVAQLKQQHLQDQQLLLDTQYRSIIKDLQDKSGKAGDDLRLNIEKARKAHGVSENYTFDNSKFEFVPPVDKLKPEVKK
jgi:hypothetical protein